MGQTDEQWVNEQMAEIQTESELDWALLLQAMQDEIGSGDGESAHWNADRLLCAALVKLSADAPMPQQDTARALVRAWCAVGKWYA